MKKENFHSLMIYGDLSSLPLDHLTSLIEAVSAAGVMETKYANESHITNLDKKVPVIIVAFTIPFLSMFSVNKYAQVSRCYVIGRVSVST